MDFRALCLSALRGFFCVVSGGTSSFLFFPMNKFLLSIRRMNRLILDLWSCTFNSGVYNKNDIDGGAPPL